MKKMVEEINLMTGTARKKFRKIKKRFAPIIDTAILLRRLGLAFRAHRDASQFHLNVGEYSSGGVGTSMEVLDYRVGGGDSVLKNDLCTCSKTE